MSHAQYRYTRKFMHTEQLCNVVGRVFVLWECDLSAGVRCTCMYDLRFAVALLHIGVALVRTCVSTGLALDRRCFVSSN